MKPLSKISLKNIITENVYFYIKTLLQLLCKHSKHAHKMKCRHRISQNTLLIRRMKAHTRWNAFNELFCCVNKINTLSKIKINQNCGEMRSNKPPFNPHRILEFGFRNTSLDKLFSLAYSTDSGTSKLPKGILGWASGAERIERARAPLRSHALYDSPLLRCSAISIQYNVIWCNGKNMIAFISLFHTDSKS